LDPLLFVVVFPIWPVLIVHWLQWDPVKMAAEQIRKLQPLQTE